MEKIIIRLLYGIVLLIILVIPVSCDEKESELGANLQDPSTIYEGTRGSTEVSAYTVLDDSLKTSGIASTIVGRYENSATYGKAEAIYYTQLGLPSKGGIDFDANCHIDSIVLNLRIEGFQPFSVDSSKLYNLHFEICQLADKLIDTIAYYSDTAIAVSDVVLYDDIHTYSERDTLLRFKLNEKSYSLFQSAANQEEFQDRLKGLRIKLKEKAGDDAMVVISLAAMSSKVTMYYKYGEDPKPLTYDFSCGQKVGHYTQFVHDYTGSPLARFDISDTLKTDPTLYLTPMGGSNIYVRMDDFIKKFHQEHPLAVIHYAEIILPVASLPEGGDPDKVYAFRKFKSGKTNPVADILDIDLSAGFDGSYDKDKKQYRMRISRHVQQLLRSQEDYGTLLVLNSRRSSALSAAISKPIRIEYIYTEIDK